MPNVSRPDLLPFALPVTIGLPFHGLVTDGSLELPDATTKTYPQPAGSWTSVVRGQQSSPVVRSESQAADDAEKNYTWQDYAILSGTRPDLGGVSIKTNPVDIARCRHWLYCDANTSWLMSASLTTSGIQQTLSVWLESPFGVFPPLDAMSRRLLASYTFTPKNYNGTSQSALTGTLQRHVVSTHSSDGAISILNIGALTITSVWEHTTLYRFDGTKLAFHDALKIVVSGNGKTADGFVGADITAAITHVATAQDMLIEATSSSSTDGDLFTYVWNSNETGDYGNPPIAQQCPDGVEPTGELEGTTWQKQYPCLGNEQFVCDGTSSAYTATNTVSEKYRYFYVVDKDGVIGYLDVERDETQAEEKTSTCGGLYWEDWNYYWVDCAYGEGVHKVLDIVVTTLSDTTEWSCTRSAAVTASKRYSFCGASNEVTYSASASETDTKSTMASVPSILDSRSVSVGDPVWPVVYMASNNLICLVSGDDIKVMAINGQSAAYSRWPAITAATLNPSTGEIAVSTAGESICYV